MQQKPRINIIGAGISGLCAGSYLQMNGFETHIFEKHSIPGGLCTSWDKGEFIIDGCAHWILGSDKGSGFYHMWSELLNLESIEFHHHEIRLSIELKNNVDKYGNKVFHMYNDLNRLRDYMLDLSPEDEKVINRFVQDIRAIQAFDLPPKMDKLPMIPSIVRGIKMSRYLKFLFILNKQRKVTNYDLAAKFKSPFLREAFELLYDGQKFKMLIFNFPQAVFDKKSAGYPIGGSLAWAQKLAEKYTSLGGTIHYNTPVHKILTENNQTTGLLVRNKVVHPCDAVLSTADWYKTVFEYLEGKYVNDKLLKLKDGKIMDVYYSILLVSFGLKKDYKEYPHFFRFPLDKKLESPCGTSWERLETHFYHYDPTLAPAGKTVMACSFYTTNGQYWIDLRKNDRVKYRETKAKFVNDLIDRLEVKYPGIREDIEVTDFATPATVLRYTNNWQGSAQGWLPGDNIIASSPVKFKLPGLKKFFYASHWGRPGGGIPVAINQGRDVAKLICKEFKKEFKTTKA
ncbi:MAG: NAD(P)/FAD-dependent oxidoreductase [Chitinophagaceae bacterium]|nr:NAD(P)/FAD-dependent oxidoreductase [Chitinophagaceae bacterium]